MTAPAMKLTTATGNRATTAPVTRPAAALGLIAVSIITSFVDDAFGLDRIVDQAIGATTRPDGSIKDLEAVELAFNAIAAVSHRNDGISPVWTGQLAAAASRVARLYGCDPGRAHRGRA